MATFPSIAPTFGAQKRSEPVVRRVQFGDGYEQRLKYGLNQNPKTWSLTFMVNTTEANTIETFLDDQAASAASFDWSPPDAPPSTGTSFLLLEDGDNLLLEDGSAFLTEDSGTTATIYKWVCDQWSKELMADSFFKIDATFRQIYEP